MRAGMISLSATATAKPHAGSLLISGFRLPGGMIHRAILSAGPVPLHRNNCDRSIGQWATWPATLGSLKEHGRWPCGDLPGQERIVANTGAFASRWFGGASGDHFREDGGMRVASVCHPPVALPAVLL